MKAIVLPVTDSGVPRIQIKPENTQDDAVLNAIINRNGEAVQPDAGYTILSFERNGGSFQSVTFGRNEDAVSGSSTGAFLITGDGGNSYQSDDLIGKRILSLYIDNGVRTPDEYTYNDTTGALVFVSPVAAGRVIQGIYRTLS
jgi:hypothetical protein